MSTAALHDPPVPPPQLNVAQDEPPPFDRRGFRVRNAHVDPPPPMRPAPPANGVADNRAYVRYGVNDTGIRRDNTPWYPIQHYTPAAKGVASWADHPARPALSQRDVTVNRRAGSDQTRYLQNPLAPGTGLHTQVLGADQHTAATVTRYGEPTLGKMTSRRQNRLSPARYDGQSYSQTTKLQGGGNMPGGNVR